MAVTPELGNPGRGDGLCLKCEEEMIMIPGEYAIQPGEIELNAGRPTLTLSVANTGDRPIQVGASRERSTIVPL